MATRLGFTLTAPRLFSAHFRKPIAAFSSTSSSSSSSWRVHFAPLVGRQVSIRRSLFNLPPKATTDQPGQFQEDEVVDSKILPYCSIDKKEKKSLGELEQEFLQALQAFYYEGKAIMSNEEFDNLKEELMWEGSSVVMLSSDEQKFLEASMAYVAGKPIMNDEDYDKLKMKLKSLGNSGFISGEWKMPCIAKLQAQLVFYANGSVLGGSHMLANQCGARRHFHLNFHLNSSYHEENNVIAGASDIFRVA